MDRERFAHKTAAVTGAGSESGIGFAAARNLVIGGLNTPMRRSGTPDEVADLIAFLASDESRYITGQLVIIDGGNTPQEYKGPIESYY